MTHLGARPSPDQSARAEANIGRSVDIHRMFGNHCPKFNLGCLPRIIRINVVYAPKRRASRRRSSKG